MITGTTVKGFCFFCALASALTVCTGGMFFGTRWFLDRTGFGVRACEVGVGLAGSFPVVDGICLLGNSQNPAVELVMPVREVPPASQLRAESPYTGSERYASCLAEIPSVGAFSYANMSTASRYYTFCLQTFRVNPNDTGGAMARCVVLSPKYIFMNALDFPLDIRQTSYSADATVLDSSVVSVNPGESAPLYWAQRKEQLVFQFKAGSAYAWSGPIFPSEEFVGGHDIAVFRVQDRRPVIFHIQIIPDNGLLTVVARAVHDPRRAASCSVVFRNHLDGVTAVFRAYHPSSHRYTNETSMVTAQAAKYNERYGHDSVQRPKGSQQLPTSSRRSVTGQTLVNSKGEPCSNRLHDSPAATDAWFRAPAHRDVLLAWPFPFTHSGFTCDVTLLNETEEALRRRPATFLINPRWRNRRCLEIRDMPLPHRCFILLETRGNVLTIDLCYETTHSVLLPWSSAAASLPDKPQAGAEPTRQLQRAPVVSTGTENSAAPCSLQFIFSLSQIGISFVSNKLKEELLFAEVSVVCGVLLQHKDNQLLEFCIGDIQIDSQLEESERPVLLANRHGGNPLLEPVRSSSFPSCGVYEISDLLPYTNGYLVHFPSSTVASTAKDGGGYGSRDPGKLLGGAPLRCTASASAPSLVGMPATDSFGRTQSRRHHQREKVAVFLHFWAERESISSSDLHLRKVQLTLDDIEVDIDAEMLNGLQHFAKECLDVFGFYQSIGIPRSVVSTWKCVPMHLHFEPRIPGQVIVLDEMCISKFTVIVWCSLLLDKINFMSDFLKMGLRILMVSQCLELKGAPITFETEVVNNTMRGSLSTLLVMMKGRYLNQAVSSIGVVLGYSSLANIPRAPLDLVRGTVGFGLTVADNVSHGLGSILSNLTFDTEYISQRQKANSRIPHSVKAGLSSATKDLKEGFLSLGDIVMKPIGGAQKDGFSGLIKGLGKGVVGTLIKPVDKLGQAVSSVASGIRAEYVTRPLGGYKCRTHRRRKPRMLSGAVGQIRPYDIGEAELRESLALKIAKDVVLSLTVFIREVPPPQHLVLLIYPTRLCFVDLYAGRGRLDVANNNEGNGITSGSTSVEPRDSVHSRPSITSQQNSVGRARILWHLESNQISAVRASTHGVVIHTPQRVRQIPCRKGTMIKQLYEEIVKSQQRAKAVLDLAKITEWLGVSDYS